MFETFRKTMKELREIRQIIRNEASGAATEQRRIAFEAKQAERKAESRAYRRTFEWALRRKPNMSMAEFCKRFPVPERGGIGSQ
jgi:hypothetical protein